MTWLVLLVHNNWDTYGITMTHVRHLIDPNCHKDLIRVSPRNGDVAKQKINEKLE